MKRITTILGLVALAFTTMANDGCENAHPVSASGVTQARTMVQTNQQGRTIEQENIIARLKMDNTPGSIKHLYIISPYSGQTILYSTVKGKVTSGGKRLTPTTVEARNSSNGNAYGGFTVGIGNYDQTTTEVLQDDGSYGTSTEYIYWWDVQGRYHQHFFTGGQIIHVSDQPIPVHSVIINLEEQK